MNLTMVSKCSIFHLTTIFISCLMLSLVSVNLTVQAYDDHSTISSSKFVQRFLDSKKGDEVIGLHRIKQYLFKYGYLNPSYIDTHTNNNSNFDDALEAAVKKYQALFHLNVSGVLDSKTLSLMVTPRCGNSDEALLKQHQHRHFHGTNITKSLYSLSSRKWIKRTLSFAVKPETRSDAFEPIAMALAAWDNISALTIVDGSNDFSSADLRFSFFQGEHGDGKPFDGPGHVLAHAFYPPKGEIHFDADEYLVIGAVSDGLDIGSLALHEIGHAIGLEHSEVEASIMYPYIEAGVVKGLDNDDILAINALYP